MPGTVSGAGVYWRVNEKLAQYPGYWIAGIFGVRMRDHNDQQVPESVG
jgi:hypothetical protein